MSGDFLRAWKPSSQVADALRAPLKMSGHYKPLLAATNFKTKLGPDARRRFVENVLVSSCVKLIHNELAESVRWPSVRQLMATVDEALNPYPPKIVRLALLNALVVGAESPGVVEYVAVMHPQLRAPSDPTLQIPDDGADAEQTDAAHRLEDARSAAEAPVGRMSSAVDLGKQVDNGDLLALMTYVAEFKSTLEAARETGFGIPEDEVTVRSLEEHRAALTRISEPPFARLSALANIQASHPVAGLEDLAAMASRLSGLSQSEVTDTDEVAGQALSRLLDFLRADGKHQAGATFELGELVMSTLPPASGGHVAVALSSGVLSLPDSAAGDAGDSANERLGNEAEDAPAPALGDPRDPSQRVDSPIESTPEIAAVAEQATIPSAPAPIPVSASSAGSRDKSGPKAKGSEDPVDLGKVVAPTHDSVEASPTQDRVPVEGSTLLAAGQLSAFLAWSTLHESPEAPAETHHQLVKAALLLEASRSPFDDFAYAASGLLSQLDVGAIRDDQLWAGIGAVVGVAGCASTGQPGFISFVTQLSTQGQMWGTDLLSIMRDLALVPAGGITVSADASDIDDRSTERIGPAETEVEWAQGFLKTAPRRRLKFQPATVVWQELAHVEGEHGCLGVAASVVAANDQRRAREVADICSELATRAAIQDRIDRVARSTPRLHNHTNVDARARQRLIEMIEDAVVHLQRWVAAAQPSSSTRGRTGLDQLTPIHLKKVLEAAVTDLAATSELKRRLCDLIEIVLSHEVVETSSMPTSDAILGWEVDIEPSIPSAPDDYADREKLNTYLPALADRDDSSEKCRALLEAGELKRATRAIEALRHLWPGWGKDLESAHADAESHLRSRLRASSDQCEVLLGQARSADLIRDEDASDILTDVELARLDDISMLQENLRILEKRLTHLRKILTDQSEELAARVAEFANSGRVTDEQRKSLGSRLQALDLRTVSEQLARIEEGSDLGVASSDLIDVRTFFPIKVEAAAQLRSSWDLVTALEQGSPELGPFDLRSLSPEDRTADCVPERGVEARVFLEAVGQVRGAAGKASSPG
ncbi:unannotated protein [freshwater metagenome]|uniref:Unannotated protein n=1 Tax=freshwater metagenome TaxID=449393 RepID=A0A6J6S672_9ZZZZ